MSSLVDMCTSEFAKLREKGQAVFSSSGNSTSPCAESRVDEHSANNIGYPLHVSEALRLKPRPTHVLCSDAAVSMMVECFSP